MSQWQVLIVDDEPLVRSRIRSLVEQSDDFEVAGECGDGQAALEVLQHDRIDLLLLDIKMPHLDGFGVLENLDTRPVVIFITAFDDHALHAFEVHAIDYLLKPFDRQRFEHALDRARQLLLGASRQQLRALIEELKNGGRQHVSRLPIRQNGRIILLETRDIDWVEAAGNYVCLHVNGDSHVLRQTMAEVESRLDPQRFVRIHRSAIINVDCIKELRPWFHGDYQVLLRNGAELTLSRARREQLEKLLGRLP